MPKNRYRVCVAIPTYNSADYIDGLLAYVVGLHPYRIYVLDDCSTDNTVAVCLQYPKVNVIAGDKNLGPSANRNRILGKDIGDIVLFIDDDIQWHSGDVFKAIQTYFADPKLGALGFSIYDGRNRQIWFANDRESNPLFFWARSLFIKRLSKVQRTVPFLYVQWLLEGAFAIRSELFKAMSGFDERFKRYQEGPDICRRLRQRGYLIGYANDVRFNHPKQLSVLALAHMGNFLRSGIIWHVRHRGKVKVKS